MPITEIAKHVYATSENKKGLTSCKEEGKKKKNRKKDH